MQEKPHSVILNRKEARDVAEQHFKDQILLLQDIANYGSNLVIRAFDSSPKRMDDIIVCCALLKQIVAMADAFEVLLTQGCGHAAYLPARSGFEASVYMDWILDGDSERRAMRYIVGNYRDARLWAKCAIPGTPEEQRISGITSMLGFNVHTNRPELAADAQKRLNKINQILAQSSFASIDAEFDAAKKRRRHDPEWYELDNIKSIKQLAEKVGRLAEYEFFCAKGSEVAHTGSYKDHIRFVRQQVRFLPIRHLADVSTLVNFEVAINLRVYRRVLERYRPGEVNAFDKKYAEDWREPFQNMPKVKYNF